MSCPVIQLTGDAVLGVGPHRFKAATAELPTTFCLGRNAPKAHPACLKLSSYLENMNLGALPPSVNWYDKASASISRVYLNDQYGDCHSADTEVLTEKGWQLWPNYDGRSLMGTMNQQTGMLEFQAPTALKRREHNGPMAYGTHRGQDFAVTPNHRFFHRPYQIPYPYVAGGAGYGDFQFAELSKLPHRCLIPGATTGFIGTQIDKLTIGDRQWDGTDFLRLLALMLSDGYASGGDTNIYRSSFCCFREDRLDMVRGFAHRMEIREEKSRPGVWVLSDRALADWLRANMYVGNNYHAPFKRIPDLVKVASQSQIEEFLRFFGDQSILDKGNRQFFTSSPHMANDLQELLLRIGKRAGLGRRDPRPGRLMGNGKWIETKHPSFTLHEWEDSDVSLLSKGQKASFAYDHYKGEVFCATVPNSTLITRRNGSVLISSNCVFAGKAHALGIWSANDSDSGGIVLATDAEIKKQYFDYTGGADNGASVSEVLDIMRSKGFMANSKLYKIDGYVSVDHTNKELTKAALAIFAANSIGFDLPSAWTNSAVWDVTNSGIIGGHDVTPCGYDEKGVYVSSWGRIYLITWAAWMSKKWITEYYAVLAPLWYGSDQIAPCGLKVDDLKADMAKIGQGIIPEITPPPPFPMPQNPYQIMLGSDLAAGQLQITQGGVVIQAAISSPMSAGLYRVTHVDPLPPG